MIRRAIRVTMMKGMRSAKQHDYEEDGRDDDDVNSDDEDDDFSMIMEQTDAKRMVIGHEQEDGEGDDHDHDWSQKFQS